jgi:hypothetical protein
MQMKQMDLQGKLQSDAIRSQTAMQTAQMKGGGVQ